MGGIGGTPPNPGFKSGVSLSGLERNRLWINLEGREFLNLSGVSAIDDPADGRAVAMLDYDRDGWVDLAVVNANAPLLQLFRNQIAELGDARPAEPPVIGIRFVGGNRESTSSDSWSNRNGIGASVRVSLGDVTLVREQRAGEGFAAQHSETLLIGTGKHPGAESVTVVWPSGRQQTLNNVTRNSLLTVFENPAESPSGTAFVVEDYAKPGTATRVASQPPPEEGSRFHLAGAPGLDSPKDEAQLRVYTSMATWCESCRGELPQIARMRATFNPSEIALFAVPVDQNDDHAMLEEYVAHHQPAYKMVFDVSDSELHSFNGIVQETLHAEGLPASIVTDRQGRVLHVGWGVPSISRIRLLLSMPRG